MAMAEREQYVRDLFRRVAPRYDFLNRLLSFREDVGWRRFTAAKARLTPRARVLDIARGTGDLAFAQARYVGKEAQVIELDFVEEMLMGARAKAQAYGLADVCQFV